MKEMFLSMLEDCKVGDAYKVNYFKEQRMVKVSVIEGYFINEGMEQIYENCIWIYIRSCLYMKSKVEGDQYES
jgi:hypothetical protein